MDAPRTLQQAILYFSDYTNCHAAVVAVRWPDGVVRCPRCDSERVTYLANARVWKCYEGHARAKFSLKVGTVFEDSRIALSKWLLGLHLMASSKKGVSAHQLHRNLGISYKAAWFMAHRIRFTMSQEPLSSKLAGVIEMDETYIGGKARGRGRGTPGHLGLVRHGPEATSHDPDPRHP